MTTEHKPTFVPKYAAAVDTCDTMIAQLHRQIAEREAALKKWEEWRKKALKLAEPSGA